ncbi:MAG TPA: hypothetical protein PKJ99_18275 [Thermoanaerobaculales bacterium]|nr:hypothetical protein [Thermoanaerobaculales bacterium]
MSDAVRVEKLTAGNIYDSATGEELESIDVQLLGAHPARVLYMPEEMKEKIEWINEFPELANVTGNRICSSSNGHEGTSGLYMGTQCSTCPHVGRCSERTIAMVHRTGDGPMATAREMPINWASQGMLTRMLTEGRLRGVPPWAVVYTLEAVERANKRGVSEVLTIAGKREATAEEIAEAESVLHSMVEPMIELLMGSTNTRPMLVAGDIGETRALPAGDRHTPRGVTVVDSAPEPIAAGAVRDEAPSPALPVNGEGESVATTPAGETPAPLSNGNGNGARVGLQGRKPLRSRVRTASAPGGDE